MKIATYNVENLFARPKAMNLESWSDGKEVLDTYTELNDLIKRSRYTTTIKNRILEILDMQNMLGSGRNQFIRLMEVRNKLIRRPRGAPPEIAVDGRADWTGWFELIDEPVNEISIFNTARIIALLNADILAVVEAENRMLLSEFNRDIVGAVCEEMPFKKRNIQPYAHTMLIDGNDTRGIDVGLMTKASFSLSSVYTHIFDEDDDGLIFSRDCAEYVVATPSGEQILCMVNHFKSKGYGGQAASDRKRTRQANRVAEIYQKRRVDFEYIAIMGDLNDTPDSQPLDALMSSDLKDASAFPRFIDGGRPGTYANGTAANKIDYLLCSPKLFSRMTAAGIERSGVWGGKHGTLFPHIDTITKEVEAASDHAAIWAEFEI